MLSEIYPKRRLVASFQSQTMHKELLKLPFVVLLIFLCKTTEADPDQDALSEEPSKLQNNAS